MKHRASNDHPNLLAAAGLAFSFSLLLLVSNAWSALHGQQVDLGSVILGTGLATLGILAVRAHRRLRAMSPSARDAYWNALEEEWQRTAARRAGLEAGAHDERRDDRRRTPRR